MVDVLSNETEEVGSQVAHAKFHQHGGTFPLTPSPTPSPGKPHLQKGRGDMRDYRGRENLPKSFPLCHTKDPYNLNEWSFMLKGAGYPKIENIKQNNMDQYIS